MTATSGDETPQSAATATTQSRHPVRRAFAPLLIGLGVICLVLSVPTIWARNLVLNTNTYVNTLAPLASNPAVQNSVITLVDNKVSAQLRKSDFVAKALPPRAEVLAGPIESAINGLVNEVTTRFVQSAAFQRAWVAVNRITHKQLVYVLTNKGGPQTALEIKGGRLILNLSPIVDQVKTALVNGGLTVAAHVPPVNATIDIADASSLEQVQGWVNLLNKVADWLPLIGLALAAGGIALARRRRRALLYTALGVAGGMVVIGVVLLIERSVYLGQLPTSIDHDTALAIYNALVRLLREAVRVVLLVSLLIALGAVVTGPGERERALRAAIARGAGGLGQRITNPEVGVFVRRHIALLRVGVVALFFLVLLLISSPTLGVVILLAVLGLLLLAVVEVLRASGPPAPTAAPTAAPSE